MAAEREEAGSWQLGPVSGELDWGSESGVWGGIGDGIGPGINTVVPIPRIVSYGVIITVMNDEPIFRPTVQSDPMRALPSSTCLI